MSKNVLFMFLSLCLLGALSQAVTTTILTSQDCNGNGIPDESDIADGTSQDCNDNGLPDECDISSGTSQDINGNGIPDECEDDCNNNGIPDECEPEPVPNLDFNLDRIVNMEDLAILAAAWLGDVDLTDVAPCGGDNITDTQDLGELADRWLDVVYYFPDICKYAQAVPIGVLFEGSTTGATATDDANDITSCACNDFYDVWLTFTSEQAGLYQFDFAGKQEFMARLAVFASCGAGEIACYKPCQGTPVLDAAARTTYYLRVAGANREVGDYQLQIDYLGQVEPMTHDECSQAVPLSIGDTYLGTSVGAAGTDITSCACEDANDVWHTVTPAVTGYYYINYTGLGNWSDSIRASVFDGCEGNEVFCHQPCSGPALVQLTGGTPYYIRIAGAYSSTGIYMLSIEPVLAADDCLDAAAIEKDKDYAGTTVGTTVSTVHASCGLYDDYDVWYAYTASQDEAIRVAITEDYNMGEPVLAVYDACGGNELACSKRPVDTSLKPQIDMMLDADQTIYIRVSANHSGVGVFILSVSTLPIPPAFSDCANAVPVLLDTPYSGTNENAFTTPGMDMYCEGYHDVWHSFTPAVSGNYTIEAVVQDTGCIVTVLDACNGNFVDCSWGSVNVSLTEGVAYKIAVAGEFADTYEAYTLTVTEESGGGE